MLEYPCIIYSLDTMDIRHADNHPYSHKKRYLITVIDMDPDSVIHEFVAKLPTAGYDRFYKADSLNHHVYRLYF